MNLNVGHVVFGAVLCCNYSCFPLTRSSTEGAGHSHELCRKRPAHLFTLSRRARLFPPATAAAAPGEGGVGPRLGSGSESEETLP